MKPFILASKSPIRQKILSDLQYDFSIEPSNAPEFFIATDSLEDNAQRLSLEKAKAVQLLHPKDIIVGSDSIMMDPFGTFLEKPKNRADAEKMMKNRSGRKEVIVSGIAIIQEENIFLSHEQTVMYWKNLSDENIQLLLDSNEWEGKCGGIMVEGLSGLFIEKIEGSLTNIMGFALTEFEKGMVDFL